MDEKLSPKARGELTEAIVLAKLIELGYGVSMPFGDNRRYDMIVDDGHRLHRVQVKTARDGRNPGTIEFSTASHHPLSGKRTKYHGQIEAFVAFHPGTGDFYWVPVEDTSGNYLILRTAPTKNNQVNGVRQAGPYRLRPAEVPEPRA
ncbi:group I intron-associated PD-(D/E)XK endonuclease [Streptomyces sp. NPDC014802]|uniref:group I intron-associated PD-(D/E)XK endonuclease n=1 Tax=Streptomyces sp. NPDC014802 TaxID=3364917 RepID=UPI0037021AAA